MKKKFVPQHQTGESGPSRSRRRIRMAMLSPVIVFGLWIFGFLATGLYAASQVSEAQEQITQTAHALSMFAFEDAERALASAHTSLEEARSVLPFARTLSWVPFAGETIDQFSQVIASVQTFLEAMDPLIELGNELLRLSGLNESYLREVQAGISPNVTFNDLSTQTKRVVLSRFAKSADDFDLLAAKLQVLEEEIGMLSRSPYAGPWLSVLDPLIEKARAAQEPLHLLAIAARLLPKFAGLEEPSSILLLFMNNNELRPAGGFIGTYGVLEMDAGDITHLETADVYALDRAVEDAVTREPPAPLKTYNATEQWFFRDSNWSPDFSVSAHQAVELFLEEGSFLDDEEKASIPTYSRVEQVIGFTPTFASSFLEITGPIEVSGQSFTSENIADLLEYQVQTGYVVSGTPEVQRKEIIADLVNEMKSRLYALPAENWPLVFEAVRGALREKQLLFWSADETIQQTLVEAGWGGTIQSKTVDALMIVDANLASLKSDPVVERRVTYEIYQNSAGDWIGRVSIHYQHHGTFDWKTTRYRTYTRVYLPLGTQLLSVEGSWLNDKTQNPTKTKGQADVSEELGLTTLGAFTSVEPGEENTLTFEFLLASEVVNAIASGAYDLTVFKQAGSQNNALTFDLDFDKNVTHASPAEDSQDWGDEVYHLNTILDQDFSLDLKL